MEIELNSKLVVLEGTSKKSGKPYRLVKLVVDSEIYGPVEILLDTRHDRAGIILDMVARECEHK